jgi:hypothetical protein
LPLKEGIIQRQASTRSDWRRLLNRIQIADLTQRFRADLYGHGNLMHNLKHLSMRFAGDDNDREGVADV